MMFMSVGAYENSTGSRDVEDMHGMIVRYPRLAFVMTIGIFGMSVVPMGMCVAKWAALKAFIDSGYVDEDLPDSLNMISYLSERSNH